MTNVDGWTLLPNRRCFPDGFDGLGNLHIKGLFELHFGEFACAGNSSCGKRWATHFVDGAAQCQPESKHLGDSATPVKLKKAPLDL